MNHDLLKEMIDRHEGNRLKKYRCPAGHWTISRGWNIDARALPVDIASYLRLYGEITPAMSDRLLNIAIDTAVAQCRSIWPDFENFSERRQLALADFIYNVGAGTALKFRKALAAIEEGDWNKAAREMEDSNYYKQVPNRAKEIVEMVRNG